MRYIAKENAPASFEEWKNLADEHWTPTYRNLRNPKRHRFISRCWRNKVVLVVTVEKRLI
jgi:hypothetical protein